MSLCKHLISLLTLFKYYLNQNQDTKLRARLSRAARFIIYLKILFSIELKCLSENVHIHNLTTRFHFYFLNHSTVESHKMFFNHISFVYYYGNKIQFQFQKLLKPRHRFECTQASKSVISILSPCQSH